MNKKLQGYLQKLILFFIGCVLLAGTQVSAQQYPANSPLGAWQRESDGQQYVMTFKLDGTGTLESAGEISSFKWSIKDNTLSMDGGGSLFLVQIVVTAETLTMTDINTQGPVVWYRPQKTPQAVQGEGQASPLITGLIGNWKNSQSAVRFNPDGNAIIGGENYKYTVNDTTITLIGYDGSIPIPYKLNGDVLNLTINGQIITFNRSLP